VFSPSDYELAARVLGLPVPETNAERAAATPIVARVLRDFGRMAPPMPGHDADGMYTGATRSLNGYPDNTQPMEKAQLASRLRVDAEPTDDEFLMQLLTAVQDNPEALQAFMMILQYLESQQDQHMDALSSQRPSEFDTPNMGSNYSILNAPSSNSIPPSVAFQQLS
jgi:uncharacterized protein YdiU (UPF0061 family)